MTPTRAPVADDLSARPPGRRERKKVQMREDLQDAALALFAERGFEHTTVEDVTDAVDVAQRTFFRYFASKDEVVLGDVAERRAALRAALAARPPSEGVVDAVVAALAGLDDGGEQTGRLRQQLVARFRLMAVTPSVRRAALDAYAGWEREIADHVAQRTGTDVRHDVLPGLVAASLMAAVRTGLTVWVAGGAKDDLPERMAQSFALVREGLDAALAGR